MDILPPDKFKNTLAIFFLVIFFVSVKITSCKRKEKEEAITSEMIERQAFSIIKSAEYHLILKMANDSISNWKKNDLKGWKGDSTTGEAKLDTVLCINSKADKTIMASLGRTWYPGSEMDAIGYLYGVKIKERWYFFPGPVIHLPRKLYQKDKYKPLDFHKLHEIAMEEIFNGYLKKNKKLEWEINEGFFSDLTSGAWYVYGKPKPVTREDWDNIYLYHVNQNWKNRDTTQYSRTL